jgi:undecaprenyl-diphosphatase
MTKPATTITAIVAIVLVCLGGAALALSGGAPLSIDTAWHSAVGVHPGSVSYSLAVMLATIGSSIGVGVSVVLAATGLLFQRKWIDAAAIVTSALIGVACSEGLKLLVARPRPIDALLQPPGSSYPSGHAMGAAMLSTALALVLFTVASSPQFRAWLVSAAAAWTLLMMWSRTALHVHWLSDTVAGALLGWAVAVLVRTSLLAIKWRRSGGPLVTGSSCTEATRARKTPR